MQTEVADTLESAIERLSDLRSFIAYLETTEDSEWVLNKVRTKGNTQNCIFGHLVNWFYGKDYQGSISLAWDVFEEMWSTTFYLYDVNDGMNKNYTQAMPKARCVAYLKDLWLGIATPTWKAMEEDFLASREQRKKAGL